MICPSCQHENTEGADRCEECLTPLFDRDIPKADREGLSRSVMEDDLNQLDQEFLAVAPDTPAIDVIRKMKDARLGCALVIDEGNLVGIFTERDVLNKLAGNTPFGNNTAVKELMSADPETLDEKDSVAAALNKMSMGRYRHLPVKKANGTYSVTSIKHVLRYIAKEDW